MSARSTVRARRVEPPVSELPQAEAVPATTHLSEVRKLREAIERHYRTNRTLTGLVHKLAGPKGEAAHVELRPRLAGATQSQHPERRPEPATDAWWPAAPVMPSAPLAAHAGHDCFSLADTIGDTVGVSVMGLRGVDLDRVVGGVAAEQRKSKDFKPVFLTDQPDFLPFVSRGYSFEYLSTFRDYLAPRAEEGRETRRGVLTTKWGLSRIVNHDDARAANRAYPPLAALLNHNTDMSRACHHDRFGWIIETLRIALSGERFDAAEGLANYLLTFFDRLEGAHQIPAARVICRKFIAFGELEKLRAFLFKNIAQVKKDDSLFTWFSTYCTGNTEFLAEFALLPSRKINVYYLSKRMAVAGDQVVPNLLAAGDGATANGNLLLANYFAIRRDAALYKMFVNRALGKHGDSLLSKVSFDQGNLLERLSFENRPPARDQHELVSVIMSSYEAAETIGYAARSILKQSYGNIELLICDDCSSDGTSRELEKLRSDPRVRLFQSKAQQGTYGIRNSLIAEARGSYVTFHDSDDFAFPDRIERQLRFLREHGAAAVVGQWFRVTGEGEFVFSSDHAVARLAVVSLFAHRGVFERFGPYRTARVAADTEFYERLRMSLGVEAVRLMTTPLILGLASANSLTRSPGIEATEDGFRAPARRAYAAAAAKRRHMGGNHAGTAPIDEILAANGILMSHAGVEELETRR
ncbi:MAG: glycosyltransferase family 2 protein [Devosia sp.]|uniref:glycosyltransferase family 2 protein n=1 Tax=Devosia sp. TaxID=1871048 RepID=UPI002637D50A|nr:glycosyltransferase family A protein [Devosia sp.]MDB5538999.1 glycosyltransferase family 2 protein [Devosia sp.]